MGSLFRKKKKVPVINKEEQTILQCKIARGNIKAYIKKLERSSAQKKQKAKEALKENNKDRARMNLRQAKMFSEQIKSADKQLEMIEDQISQIEIARNQRNAMKVLQQGNEILKQLHKEVNVEKFEQIAEDMDEMKAQQDEIAKFFKSKGLNPEEEEEEINSELDKLMQAVGYSVDKELPDAETTKLKKQKEKNREDKEKQAIAA